MSDELRRWPDRATLHRQVIGGLRSAIQAHGPVTREWLDSAAKRVVCQIDALLRDPSWQAALPAPLEAFLDAWDALGARDRERFANYVWGELPAGGQPSWEEVLAALERVPGQLRELRCQSCRAVATQTRMPVAANGPPMQLCDDCAGVMADLGAVRGDGIDDDVRRIEDDVRAWAERALTVKPSRQAIAETTANMIETLMRRMGYGDDEVAPARASVRVSQNLLESGRVDITFEVPPDVNAELKRLSS